MTQVSAAHNEPNNSIVFSAERLPPAAWQAIYYHLSKKTETNRRLYSGSFEIEKSHIVDLVRRLEQAIVPLSPTAQKTEISINFRHDSSENLSDLSKFSDINVEHKGSPTKSIAIDFDFVICPATEFKVEKNIPQKFKVFILLDQDFFHDKDPEQAGFFDDGVAGKNILSVIEYSDYVISRSLRMAIDEWVDTLTKRHPSYILKAIPKFVKFSRGSIPYVLSSAAIFPIISVDFDGSEKIISIVTLAVMIAILTLGLSKFFVRWVLDAVAKIQPTTYLLITSGDLKRKREIEETIRRRSRIFGFISVAVITAFIVGVFSGVTANAIGRFL